MILPLNYKIHLIFLYWQKAWNYDQHLKLNSQAIYFSNSIFLNFMQQVHKGLFTNYVDKILAFFDHLPPCVDIFYGMN